MSVLFVVGRFQEARTAFRLAEEMARDGGKIYFMFTGKGCLHATDGELMKSLEYAEGIHCLKSDCEKEGILDKMVEGVKPSDYHVWIGLVEECEKIVSWV